MKATLEVDGDTFEVALVRKGDAWQVEVDGEAFTASLQPNGSGALVRVGDRVLHVHPGPREARIDGHAVPYRIHAVSGVGAKEGAGGGHATHVRPPMNGKLERIAVTVGQQVAKGDVLFVLEAMKMHNEVRSPTAGRVKAIHLAAGATVEPRQVVLDLEPL